MSEVFFPEATDDDSLSGRFRTAGLIRRNHEGLPPLDLFPTETRKGPSEPSASLEQADGKAGKKTKQKQMASFIYF